MKRVAIVQSSYIPWKGYFDLIAAVDEFVLYDDVQYTRRDWRNRNRIKTPLGLQWLTVPVRVKGRYHQTIRDTEIDGTAWATSHLAAMQQNYARAPFYAAVTHEIASAYRALPARLSELNRVLIQTVCGYLGVATPIRSSVELTVAGDRSQRLANMCAALGAGEYVSGPSAKAYLDEAEFTRRGMAVRWYDYDGYPEYPQLWGPFEHRVTILDLLFNCGPDAPRYMRHVRA